MTTTAVRRWIGFDPARDDSFPSYAFICGSCDRMHHNTTGEWPEGWDVLPAPDAPASNILCPDCRHADVQPTIAERPTTPFRLFLEKQDSGEFLIAMTPENVLMRWLPLGFYLPPAQARDLAAQLNIYAALAEKPGSAPDGKGGVAHG